VSEQAKAEIIAIGNELLLGDVPDTNTNWLCKRITGVGGLVTRAAMVRDENDLIVAEILWAVARGPDLILTTGGLGPTSDDITMQAVAEATGRPLELHPEGLAMVQATYEKLAERGYVQDATLTDYRKKMAYLPKGATAVDNPVGAAPAVVVEMGRTTLISLPGVPDEMKGIYDDTLQPTLGKILGDSYYQERLLIALCGDESLLAPLLAQVIEAHPDVYIKSRARRYGAEVRIEIVLASRGESRQEVEARIESAVESLEASLGREGFGIEREPSQ
jgi:nicotinamide-nucleotide amidase